MESRRGTQRIHCRFGQLLLAFAFLALWFGSAQSCHAQNPNREKEWQEVSTLLSGIHGITTAPRKDLINPKYTSGALMGNGDIGVVAGDESVARQSFYFGKSDFWGAGAHYEGISDVEDELHNAPDCNWACRVSILSLGKLTISASAQAQGGDAIYRVDQDILHARVDTTLRFGAATVHLRSWTADGVNLFVTEVTAENGGPAGTPIQVSLEMPTPGPGAPTNFPAAVGVQNNVLWATRENAATGSQDYKARAAVAVSILGTRLISTNSASGIADASFVLKAGTPVWIVTVFESDARMGLNGPTSTELSERAMRRAANTSAAQVHLLEQTHLQWWKKFWLQSFVQVHDKVLEDYYYGALYVVGCASRPGKLAPSLFGNFITTNEVAWGGLYFMNYNEEAPYYGVFSSNHAELAEPYIDMVLAQIPWQKNLTAAAGYKGISFERTFSPFTVIAAPPEPIPIALHKDYTRLPSDQKSNATFSLLPAIQYYDYTQDREFLKNKLYPALKELDAFWRDFAVRDSSGERWVFEHSSAHEGGDDVNPDLDIGFAQRVDRELIATSQVLHVDAEMRPVWQDFIDQLSPYPSGTVNGKTVYYIAASIRNKIQNNGLFEPGDQPINLEGAVFPGENLSIGGDPEELQIARNSLEEMNSWSATSGPNSENGFCKVFPIAARIGWPAEDLVAKFKAAIVYGWRPSNLTVFQDGGGIETSGAIEGLDSMLLQHEDGVLRVFPDWPSAMDASFTRLRAKGAFLVSSEQRHGLVTSIEIHSEQGSPLTIQSPWARHPVGVNGGSSILRPDGLGRIQLSTTPGGNYRLVRR
jgi:hypothetical protein